MSSARIILAGLGARSRIWRQVLDADPRATIVGLVETDPARLAAALAERSGVAGVAGVVGVVGGRSIAEVAARVEADAVLLVTPPAGRHAH